MNNIFSTNFNSVQFILDSIAYKIESEEKKERDKKIEDEYRNSFIKRLERKSKK